jgi:adenosylhomocysteine nucleosidase
VTEYLVVSAIAAEAKYVPEGIPVVVTGVGKTAAAVATTRALAARDTTDLVVLNIGTTGALRDGLTGLFLPSEVINHDINADAVRAIGLDPQESLTIDGGDGTVLASGDVFVTDPAVRDRLAGRAQLVDMEGYGVAFACREYGVPVRLVKHVSDSADEAAMDWPALVDASAKVLGDWVRAEVGEDLGLAR